MSSLLTDLSFWLLGIDRQIDTKIRVFIIVALILKGIAWIETAQVIVPIQMALIPTMTMLEKRRKIEKTTEREDITLCMLEKSIKMEDTLLSGN